MSSIKPLRIACALHRADCYVVYAQAFKLSEDDIDVFRAVESLCQQYGADCDIFFIQADDEKSEVIIAEFNGEYSSDFETFSTYGVGLPIVFSQGSFSILPQNPFVRERYFPLLYEVIRNAGPLSNCADVARLATRELRIMLDMEAQNAQV